MCFQWILSVIKYFFIKVFIIKTIIFNIYNRLTVQCILRLLCTGSITSRQYISPCDLSDDHSQVQQNLDDPASYLQSLSLLQTCFILSYGQTHFQLSETRDYLK